jgi:hypothetical protein
MPWPVVVAGTEKRPRSLSLQTPFQITWEGVLLFGFPFKSVMHSIQLFNFNLACRCGDSWVRKSPRAAKARADTGGYEMQPEDRTGAVR